MDRARRTLALALATGVCASAAALTAGCSATNPQQTIAKYDPVDGETVDIGALEVDNLLVVSKEGTDGPGNLIARVTNTSSDVASITFSGAGDADLAATFTVPSGSAVSISPNGSSSARLNTVGVEPGGLVDIKVSTDAGASARTVQVPVLSGAQPYYSSLVPTPTPTPTFTPAPAPTTSRPGGPTTRPSAPTSSSTLRPSTPAPVTSTRSASPTTDT